MQQLKTLVTVKKNRRLSP